MIYLYYKSLPMSYSFNSRIGNCHFSTRREFSIMTEHAIFHSRLTNKCYSSRNHFYVRSVYYHVV